MRVLEIVGGSARRRNLESRGVRFLAGWSVARRRLQRPEIVEVGFCDLERLGGAELGSMARHDPCGWVTPKQLDQSGQRRAVGDRGCGEGELDSGEMVADPEQVQLANP